MAARHPRFFAHSRAAYTLVELLIVIMIAILLMVVTLPVAKSVMEDARPREASRILNSLIVATKARAAQTDRFAGIEFVMQRMNDPMVTTPVYQCTQLYMCEVPAMYAGDTTTAVATVDLYQPPMNSTAPWYKLIFQDYVPSGGAPENNHGTPATMNYLADVAPLQNPGPGGNEDTFQIRFDHRGPWYDARRHTMNANEFQILLNGSTYPISANSNSNTNVYRYSSFQVRRPPQRVGNAVELPRSTCIDMSYSGVGQQGIEFGTAIGLRVMFGPAGNVANVTMSEPPTGSGTANVVTSGPPLGTIHFLVGLVSKINLPTEANTDYTINLYDPEMSNLADGNALWVSVSRSSGVVTTNENNPPLFSTVMNPNMPASQLAYVSGARQFATAREQKGGK
jgi:type II secretory pathway pseudopilin PulG